MLASKKRKSTPGLKQRRFRQRLIAYRETRPARGKRKISRSAVPSFFTLMNLFCGFISLIQVLEGRLAAAAWLILLASMFDILDGMVARLTKGESQFGVELDSLSDIVSFGVAPSFMIYVFGLREFGMAGVIIASLPALAGAVRLAKYNVDFEEEKGDYFNGLPIPVAGLAIVAIILNADLVLQFIEFVGEVNVTMITVIVLSGLMVSKIPFDSAPHPSAAYIRSHALKVFLVTGGFILVIIFREKGLLFILIVYLLIGTGRALVLFVKAIRDVELQNPE